MNKIFGIDISEWQAGINLQTVKNEGVKFIILRGAYHLRLDKQFKAFYDKCKELELPVGVYLYSTAKTASEARAEANFMIANVLEGRKFEYPVYFDVEESYHKTLGKSALDAIISAFCDTIEAAGYFAGVYGNQDFYKNYYNGAALSKKYSWWMAQWTSKEVTGFPMWQFGGDTNFIRSNKIAGKVCDQNYCYVEFPKIIKEKGLNGYGKASADRETVRKRFGFNDATMDYLENYKYSADLLKKLASTK